MYIFTNKADSSVTVSRYIARFPAGTWDAAHSTLDADYYDSSTFIEASDVTADSNGYTESKHYTGNTYGRVIDCKRHSRRSKVVAMKRISVLIHEIR